MKRRNSKPTATERECAQLCELFPALPASDCTRAYEQAGRRLKRAYASLARKSGEHMLEDGDDVFPENGRLRLKEVVGDLFSCEPGTSLVHCVSVDLRMGKGIATLFKEKFGGVDELKAHKPKIGDALILKREHNGSTRFVYYLITKQNYWDKPSYSSLRLTLEQLKEHCMTNNVTELAMPRIGCGLDGLVWIAVKKIIVEVFSETDIIITVYRL